MNAVLEEWNSADESIAAESMLACCGSRRWATEMVALRPIVSIVALRDAADRVWDAVGEVDWLEAFGAHPRIGERKTADASKQSSAWSQQEQANIGYAPQDVTRELTEGNAAYEQRFGFTYIVCATGKSAEEMLAILKRRLGNDSMAELREAAEQQRQIMQIRLGKWLLS